MIRKEIIIFLIVGTTTVLVDFLSYKLLLWFGNGYNPAKAIGFITGTAFAYFANRAWTFGHVEHKPNSLGRFCLVYTLTLSANVLVNRLFLFTFEDWGQAVQIAFLIATGVSATLNFLGMKFFVFRPHTANEKVAL